MKQVLCIVFLSSILFCSTSLTTVELSNQSVVIEKLKGMWVLDSVQIKEIMSGDEVHMTVRPGGQAKFNQMWMQRFKLDDDGKASYSETVHGNIPDRLFFVTDVPYKIEAIDENTATLIIDGVPDYKILNIRFSDNTLLISQSFVTDYHRQDIEVFWTLFYHKSEHSDSH